MTRSRCSAVAFTSALALVCAFAGAASSSSSLAVTVHTKVQSRAEQAPAATSYIFVRKQDPNRTVVRDGSGRWLATFTDGAYTVRLTGPPRTFGERSTAHSVSSTVWVRALPAPFRGRIDEAWLTARLADRSPDVLAIAAGYVEGMPPLFRSGLRVAGDADYGPLLDDGTRQEGSDFNDYLGIRWSYGEYVDEPEAAQLNSLDCSGFMRMVWGYRTGLPLTLEPNGSAIPRRAFEMLDSAPGVVIMSRTAPTTSLRRLAPGDLVFFDASTDDGRRIDHVGMFLGADSGGHYRFISSRKTVNGPTLGDIGGKSILDGTGMYATSFRAARRL
jgi:hypothetical protein